jgi:hypothetical protein
VAAVDDELTKSGTVVPRCELRELATSAAEVDTGQVVGEPRHLARHREYFRFDYDRRELVGGERKAPEFHFLEGCAQ